MKIAGESPIRITEICGWKRGREGREGSSRGGGAVMNREQRRAERRQKEQ